MKKPFPGGTLASAALAVALALCPICASKPIDSHAPMIALVGAGQGVSVMPNEAEALPHPRVVFVPLHHPVDYARSTTLWRKETPSESLDKYLKILVEHIQD